MRTKIKNDYMFDKTVIEEENKIRWKMLKFFKLNIFLIWNIFVYWIGSHVSSFMAHGEEWNGLQRWKKYSTKDWIMYIEWWQIWTRNEYKM